MPDRPASAFVGSTEVLGAYHSGGGRVLRSSFLFSFLRLFRLFRRGYIPSSVGNRFIRQSQCLIGGLVGIRAFIAGVPDARTLNSVMRESVAVSRASSGISRKYKGVLFGAAAVGGLVVAYHAQAARSARARKPKPSEPGSEAGSVGKNKARRKRYSIQKLVKGLVRIVGRDKLLALLALTVSKTLLSNRLAKLQGYLFRAAFLRRVPLFVRNIGENVVLCGAAAFLEATIKKCVSNIELVWRGHLTQRIHTDYFENMMYYKMGYVDRRVEHAEHIICEDVPMLTSGLAELAQELLTACVDAAFYSYQLKRYSGTHGYTLSVLGYVMGVGAFMTVAAPNFGGLYKKKQALESQYRNMQYRLMQNSESVAFYEGTEREGGLIREVYGKLVGHSRVLMGKQWRFLMVQDFLLKYLGATVAVALIIGPFFGGHLRPEATVMGRAQMLSNMRYHTSVIISLFGALGTLGSAGRKVLKLGAYSDRIQETLEVMKSIVEQRSEGGRFEESGDSIQFIDATVVTPGDATLVRDLSLNVPAGVNLLVTGPNGAGKSSLFRVLGGLWPLTSGTIKKPGGGGGETGLSHDIFYVPQKPYVAVGTLQEQLLYPLSPKDAGLIPQDALRVLLASVDLEYLLERDADNGTGTLEAGKCTSDHEVRNWGEILSLGEQQRLGMARLFYHKPRFAILDECTSGVTVEMEERFCNAVKDMGCTCITISHRPALMAFHDIVLNLDGEGGWSLHQGHRDTNRDVMKLVGSNDVPALSPTGSSSSGNNAKMRRSDVDEVLRGMTQSTASLQPGALNRGSSIELTDGNEGYHEFIVAKSPEKDDSPVVWRTIDSPSMTLTSKWMGVLKVILGDPRDSGIKVGTVTAVIVLRTLLQDRIAKLNGRSVDLVLRQDLRGFVMLIGQSVLQSAASAILAPSLRHVADTLALTWRSRLTNAILDRYLKGHAPYTVSQLQNFKQIDQSVTRDVDRLSNDLAALVPTLVKPVTDIAWFSLQLWRLTGPRGALILYSYAIIGYGCLRMVTPDFASLLNDQYELEGAFRGSHTRLRTHAESIAFFDGGLREGREVNKHYERLVAHMQKLIQLKWSYGAADDFFAKQLPHSVTWVLTLLYALDQRRDFGDSKFQGYLVLQIRYLASVVTQCFSAFGELLALPKRFAEISGSINRVSDSLRAVELANQLEVSIMMEASRSVSSDRIEFSNVDIVSPHCDVMARKLSFSLVEGKSMLITGPNGSGKTSIFRTLAGLWPSSGGTMSCPSSGVFYVTQRNYTTVGTLRDQVVYPLTVDAALKKFGCALDGLDAKLDDLMSVVRLRYLIEREGGWDTEKSWGEVLSLGEQQRMGMARMFFHRPIFAVLDDCTNAMSVDVEESLYRHATGTLGINIVTMANRTALVKYHDYELKLGEKGDRGEWTLRQIERNG